MPLPNQVTPNQNFEPPYVLRGGSPMMITTPGADETESSISGDHMPEDLSQEITIPPPNVLSKSPPPMVSPLPDVPTEAELRDMEEEQAQAAMQAEQDAADRAAEQQERAQEAAENFASRKAREDDNDDLFGLSEEDVMGGSEEEMDSDFNIDDDDFSVDNEDIMGGSPDDFSDILEVKQEDVLGKPPAQAPLRKTRRVRGSSSPVNPQLGGMAY